MPRCFSMSIQSETAWRALCLPLTEPAWLMAPPYSSSFSVRVVLPASGWLMMANVRRRSISSRFVIVPLSFYRERNDAYDGFRSALHGSGLLTVPSDLSMTHIFYITPKRPRRARGKSAVLGLFFQHKAGQGARWRPSWQSCRSIPCTAPGAACAARRGPPAFRCPRSPRRCTAPRRGRRRDAAPWRAASSAGMLVPALLWTVWSAPGSHPKLNITPVGGTGLEVVQKVLRGCPSTSRQRRGRDPLPFQAGGGGLQGRGPGYRRQAPALPLRPGGTKKGGIPAIAAGGVHQQPGALQAGRPGTPGPAGRRSGRVLRRRTSRPASGRKPNLAQKGLLPRLLRQRRGKTAGGVCGVAAQAVQHPAAAGREP